jgi:4-amino-4-deoxy-L-arabinose transferase-like glycosyltransferase
MQVIKSSLSKIDIPKLVLFLLIAVTTLTYAGGAANLFVAEDFDHLAFQMPGASWSKMLSFQFRPLRLILMAAIDRMFGINPVPHRLLSLFCHCLSVLLVYYCMRLLTDNTRQSIITAILFALYPRHHEPILWMGASQYVRTTFFFLVSIVAFLLFAKRNQKIWLLVSIIAFGLALSSHEVAATLPFILFALEYTFFKRATRRDLRSFGKYALYAGCLIAYLLVALWVKGQNSGGAIEGYHLTGLGMREVRSFASYLVYLVFPHLKLRSLDVSPLTILMSTVVVLGLLVTLIKNPRHSRFWILWILITLQPFVFFVPFGNADRYFYLPAVGVCALAAALGESGYERLNKINRTVARTLTAGLLVVYVGTSILIAQRQLKDWEEAGKMAQDLIEQVEDLYPHLEPEAHVYVGNLPGRYGYAYVFLGGGFQGAMRLTYGDPSIRVFTTRDPIVLSQIESSTSNAPPLSGTYLFLYSHDEQTMIDYTANVGALTAVLNSPVWYSFDW